MKDEISAGIIAWSLISMFLYPAVFRWIWNWQLGDIYTFAYWQAFWLSIAIAFLLDIGSYIRLGDKR